MNPYILENIENLLASDIMPQTFDVLVRIYDTLLANVSLSSIPPRLSELIKRNHDEFANNYHKKYWKTPYVGDIKVEGFDITPDYIHETETHVIVVDYTLSVNEGIAGEKFLKYIDLARHLANKSGKKYDVKIITFNDAPDCLNRELDEVIADLKFLAYKNLEGEKTDYSITSDGKLYFNYEKRDDPEVVNWQKLTPDSFTEAVNEFEVNLSQLPIRSYQKRYDLTFYSQEDEVKEGNPFQLGFLYSGDSDRFNFLKKISMSTMEKGSLKVYRDKMALTDSEGRISLRKRYKNYLQAPYLNDTWGIYISNKEDVRKDPWVCHSKKSDPVFRSQKETWPLNKNDSYLYKSLSQLSLRRTFPLFSDSIKKDPSFFSNESQKLGDMEDILKMTVLPSMMRFSHEVWEWVYSYSVLKSTFSKICTRNTANKNHFLIMSPKPPKPHKSRKFCHVWVSKKDPNNSEFTDCKDDFKTVEIQPGIWIYMTKWFEVDIGVAFDMSRRYYQWRHLVVDLYYRFEKQCPHWKDKLREELCIISMLMLSHRKNMNILASFMKEALHASKSDWGFVTSDYFKVKMDLVSSCSTESFLIKKCLNWIVQNAKNKENLISFSNVILPIENLPFYCALKAFTTKQSINKKSSLIKVFSEYKKIDAEYKEIEVKIREGQTPIDSLSYFDPHFIKEICDFFKQKARLPDKKTLMFDCMRNNKLLEPLLKLSNTKKMFKSPLNNVTTFYEYIKLSTLGSYAHEFVFDKECVSNVDAKVQDGPSREFYILNMIKELFKAADSIMSTFTKYIPQEFLKLAGDKKFMRAHAYLADKMSNIFLTWDSKKWSLSFNVDVFICMLDQFKEFMFEREYETVYIALMKLKEKKIYIPFGSEDVNTVFNIKENMRKKGIEISHNDNDVLEIFRVGFMQGQFNVISSMLFSLVLFYLTENKIIDAAGCQSDDMFACFSSQNDEETKTRMKAVLVALKKACIKMSPEKTKGGKILEFLSKYRVKDGLLPSYLKDIMGMYGSLNNGNYHLDYLDSQGRIKNCIEKGMPYIHAYIAQQNFREILSEMHRLDLNMMDENIPSNAYGYPINNPKLIRTFGSFAQYMSNLDNDKFVNYVGVLMSEQLLQGKEVNELVDLIYYPKTKRETKGQNKIIETLKIDKQKALELLEKKPYLRVVNCKKVENVYLQEYLRPLYGTFYKGLLPTQHDLYVKGKFNSQVKNEFSDKETVQMLEIQEYIKRLRNSLKNFTIEECRSKLIKTLSTRFTGFEGISIKLKETAYIKTDVNYYVRPNLARYQVKDKFKLRNPIDTILAHILCDESEIAYHRITNIDQLDMDIIKVKDIKEQLISTGVPEKFVWNIVKEILIDGQKKSHVVYTLSNRSTDFEQSEFDFGANFAPNCSYVPIKMSDFSDDIKKQSHTVANKFIDSCNALISCYMKYWPTNKQVFKSLLMTECYNGQTFRMLLGNLDRTYVYMPLSMKFSLYMIAYNCDILKHVPIRALWNDQNVYIQHAGAICIVNRGRKISLTVNSLDSDFIMYCLGYYFKKNVTRANIRDVLDTMVERQYPGINFSSNDLIEMEDGYNIRYDINLSIDDMPETTIDWDKITNSNGDLVYQIQTREFSTEYINDEIKKFATSTVEFVVDDMVINKFFDLSEYDTVEKQMEAVANVLGIPNTRVNKKILGIISYEIELIEDKYPQAIIENLESLLKVLMVNDKKSTNNPSEARIRFLIRSIANTWFSKDVITIPVEYDNDIFIPQNIEVSEEVSNPYLIWLSYTEVVPSIRVKIENAENYYLLIKQYNTKLKVYEYFSDLDRQNKVDIDENKLIDMMTVEDDEEI